MRRIWIMMGQLEMGKMGLPVEKNKIYRKTMKIWEKMENYFKIAIRMI